MFRLQHWYNDGSKAMTAATMAATAHDTFTLESDPLCCNYGFLFFYILFSCPESCLRQSRTLRTSPAHTLTHTRTPNAVTYSEYSLTLQICCFWCVLRQLLWIHELMYTVRATRYTFGKIRNGIFYSFFSFAQSIQTKSGGERESRTPNTKYISLLQLMVVQQSCASNKCFRRFGGAYTRSSKNSNDIWCAVRTRALPMPRV